MSNFTLDRMFDCVKCNTTPYGTILQKGKKKFKCWIWCKCDIGSQVWIDDAQSKSLSFNAALKAWQKYNKI